MSYKIIDLPGLGRPFNATDIIEVSANGTGSYKASIGNFTLGGENYIFVNSNGTPTENGNAVKYAYSLAQTMTPNGNPLDYNNKIIILLAPGYYTFKEEFEGPFVVDQNWIDFESLTGSRDVFFSSILVDSSAPGISVNISGIDTTKNNYYPHAAFAVASSGGIDEGLTIQNCKGGDYSFSSFSAGFSGTYNNCEANTYSFCSSGDSLTPPDGIISTYTNDVDNFGNIINCKADGFSFCSNTSIATPVGKSINYGNIRNCTAKSNSFCYSEYISKNTGVIEDCQGDNYTFCATIDSDGTGESLNNGFIVNCRIYGNGGCVYSGASVDFNSAKNLGLISGCYSTGDSSFVINDGVSIANNQGKILNCYTEGQGFCGSDGKNQGNIIECTAREKSFCSDSPLGNSAEILRCTLLGDNFTVGVTSGGRVVLGIDTTGVVNF
jgi:hypothetical protein